MPPEPQPDRTRPAEPGDLAALADTLARAFDHDPVMAWLVADGRRRSTRMRRFYATMARLHLRHDGAWTDEDRAAVALWAPPGQWKGTVGDILRSAPAMISALQGRVPRALRLESTMEDAHPRTPHWYLAFLGTHPDNQGQGRGRAVMTPVLDRCDQQGVGAYLESSREDNILYYERFGFRVTGELSIPGSPTLWPMWRAPRETSEG